MSFNLPLLTIVLVSLLHCPARTQEEPGRELLQIESQPCGSNSSNNTLTDALKNVTDNQTLVLLPGTHCIKESILVQGVSNFRIIGTNEKTFINCGSGIGVAFHAITGLSLVNVSIEECGTNLDNIQTFLMALKVRVDFFFEFHNMSNQSISLSVGDVADFQMENVVVSSSGLGLLAINLMGQSSLDRVMFKNNSHICEFLAKTNWALGGGALITYHDYTNDSAENTTDPYSFTSATLSISNTHFQDNYYCGYGSVIDRFTAYYTYSEDTPRSPIGGGGGLTLQLTQLHYDVSVVVSDCIFHNNTSVLGSGAFVVVYTGVPDSSISFLRCNFTSNGLFFSSYKESLLFPAFASGIAIIFDYVQPYFSINKTRLNSKRISVKVEDSVFRNNHAYSGTVSLLSLSNLVVPMHRGQFVNFTRCIFEHNEAVIGPAVYALEQKFNPFKLGATLVFRNVTIASNKLVKEQRIQSPSDASGIIHLVNFNASFSGTSRLMNNEGTALKLDSSLMIFEDDITFCNNSATYGGAIQAIGVSYMTFTPHSTVNFLSNIAAVAGGAIYARINSIIPDPQSSCLLTFLTIFDCFEDSLVIGCGDVTQLGVEINFEDNQASLGSVMYGSSLRNCLWAIKFKQKYEQLFANWTSIFEIFYEVQQSPKHYNFTPPFTFDAPPNSIAEVATPVFTLNVSTVSIDSESSSEPLTDLKIAPGIQKNVQLAAYDHFNRLAPAAVTSIVYNHGFTSTIGHGYSFINYNSTEEAPFSVSTDSFPDNETNITVSFFTIESLSAEWSINISFLECPNGFFFNKTLGSCVCYEVLRDFNVYCTPEGDLLVPLNTWVGKDDDGILTILHCPFDYCKSSITVLGESSGDFDYSGQCQKDHKRSGLGCGGCSANYSLTLGSNSCAKCSNKYLFLILLFAVYAVALMWIITNGRLSITSGFTNALLFFSNIASLFGSVYSRNFNSAFIVFYWLSFKVGFETCFFDGMKPLHLAALNFVFPFYLYILLLIIYIMAEKSSRFSLWLSKRRCTPTHLFVTILIMTYSSLLESCVQVLSATTGNVIKPNGETAKHIHWRYDPSQIYFRGGHAVLGTFSILMLIFFLIPLPFVCMLNISVQQIKFFSRYKPFFDAIWVPFKPRYRFWVSMRLLLRVLPLIFFYLSSLPINLFMLGFLLIIFSFVHGMVQPYEAMAQNIFDGFLLLILTLITYVSLYYSLFLDQIGVTDNMDCIESTNEQLGIYEGRQRLAVFILMGIAYIACAVMFVWHFLSIHQKWSKNIARTFRTCWNRITKKKKRVMNGFSPTRTDFTIPEDTDDNDVDPGDTYGSTKTLLTPTITTFSELRESILEDSVTAKELSSS